MLIIKYEYQIDKTYFKEVNKNAALPDLEIYLNLSTDTIYVYNSMYVNLKLYLSNKKLYAVNFYVNDTLVKATQEAGLGNYSLRIDPYNRAQFKVLAEIVTSSGTGSLADKVGAEAFIFRSKV